MLGRTQRAYLIIQSNGRNKGEYKVKYIGKKMIEDGLMAKIIVPFLDEYGLAARIGDNWFWFG